MVTPGFSSQRRPIHRTKIDKFSLKRRLVINMCNIHIKTLVLTECLIATAHKNM